MSSNRLEHVQMMSHICLMPLDKVGWWFVQTSLCRWWCSQVAAKPRKVNPHKRRRRLPVYSYSTAAIRRLVYLQRSHLGCGNWSLLRLATHLGLVCAMTVLSALSPPLHSTTRATTPTTDICFRNCSVSLLCYIRQIWDWDNNNQRTREKYV